MVLKIYALFTLLFFSSVQCNQLEEQECPQNPISSFNNGPDFDRQVRGYGKSDLAGGVGYKAMLNIKARYFDDEIPENKVMQITRLRFWEYIRIPGNIYGMEATYHLQNGTIMTHLHGEMYGTSLKVIDIHPGDTIVEIQVESYGLGIINRLVITIELQTGDTVTHVIGQNEGNLPVDDAIWKGPILGFYGIFITYRETYITGIGVYYARIPIQGPEFGGTGGREWTDPILTNTPQISNIDKIIIHHGMSIDSIQVYYLTMWGDVVRGDSHGGTGGTPETIDLEPGEMIIQMDTTSSESLLSSVMFTSRKYDGTEVQYGPYGTPSNNKEGSTSGKIIGFYGTEGHVLDSLGVYSMDC